MRRPTHRGRTEAATRCRARKLGSLPPTSESGGHESRARTGRAARPAPSRVPDPALCLHAGRGWLTYVVHSIGGLPILLRILDLLAQRVCGRLSSATEAELGEDVRDVVLGRSPADVEPVGGPRVRASLGEERSTTSVSRRPPLLARGGIRAAPSMQRQCRVSDRAETLERRQRVPCLDDCRCGRVPAERSWPRATRACAASRVRPALRTARAPPGSRPPLARSPSGSDRSLDELGDGVCPVVFAVDGKSGQLVECVLGSGEVATCELHLDQQGERGRATRPPGGVSRRSGRGPPPERDRRVANAILANNRLAFVCQSTLSSSVRPPRIFPAGDAQARGLSFARGPARPAGTIRGGRTSAGGLRLAHERQAVTREDRIGTRRSRSGGGPSGCLCLESTPPSDSDCAAALALLVEVQILQVATSPLPKTHSTSCPLLRSTAKTTGHTPSPSSSRERSEPRLGRRASAKADFQAALELFSGLGLTLEAAQARVALARTLPLARARSGSRRGTARVGDVRASRRDPRRRRCRCRAPRTRGPGADLPEGLRGADQARDGGPVAPRRGMLERRDRPPALHQPANGRAPRRAHPRQARPP